MRGSRKCGTCQWFEDKSEDFRERFIQKDGLCHWRMPATVAADSQGWGSWHQKGPAAVCKEDWCSCWQTPQYQTIEETLQSALFEAGTKLITAPAAPEAAHVAESHWLC